MGFAARRSLDEQRKLLRAYELRVWLLAGFWDLMLPVFCPFAGVPSSQMTLFKV